MSEVLCKTKQNKTKQNKTKQNKTKQNKTKQNKTRGTAESGAFTALSYLNFILWSFLPQKSMVYRITF